MKTRTNNKIIFCNQCHGVKGAHAGFFCDEFCKRAHNEHEEARPENKAIFVYMNWNMLGLTKGNRAIPHRFSAFIHTGHELVCVALFEEEDLLAIGDGEANAYDGWWREVGQLNISLEHMGTMPHRPKVMRELGILSYLCDEYGITTERNVASAIGTISHEEGMDPIELFNTL